MQITNRFKIVILMCLERRRRDVVEWCKGANLQELSHSADDRSN